MHVRAAGASHTTANLRSLEHAALRVFLEDEGRQCVARSLLRPLGLADHPPITGTSFLSLRTTCSVSCTEGQRRSVRTSRAPHARDFALTLELLSADFKRHWLRRADDR